MTTTIPTTNSPLRAVKFDINPAQSVQTIKPASTAIVADNPAQTYFGVARTHREVLDSWRLVHNCYADKGLIASNNYGLHTSTQAINVQTTVILGRTNGKIDSTLSVIPDGPSGLPLDQVYPHILDKLRKRGRHLFEVGLLADARQNVSRDLAQSFGAMRYAFYRTYLAQGDIVIGVHPRHADFYTRMMGMELIGELSSHPKVNNRPVVPMLLDTTRIRLEPLPRMLRYFKANPVDMAAYDCCFRFGKARMARSPIQRFINYTTAVEKFKQFETSASRLPMQHVGNL